MEPSWTWASARYKTQRRTEPARDACPAQTYSASERVQRELFSEPRCSTQRPPDELHSTSVLFLLFGDCPRFPSAPTAKSFFRNASVCSCFAQKKRAFFSVLLLIVFLRWVINRKLFDLKVLKKCVWVSIAQPLGSQRCESHAQNNDVVI